MLGAHQGVFITSPEYSASVTPLLKNAIDWVSRVRERGEPNYAAFKGRVFAIGAASPGSAGGLRSLMALRQILELGCGALVHPGADHGRPRRPGVRRHGQPQGRNPAAALKALVRRLIEMAGFMARATE